MLKNNSLLAIVYGVLFFCIIWVFFASKFQNWDNTLVFKYPDTNIEFAWEEIPFDGNNFDNKERFDKEFLLTSNNLYQFYLYVKRYPLYIPYIEKELEKAWIPDDFKYLPIAESALRDDVVSSAGAGWIWQFMPDTWKRYWLRIDDEVDERYHFEKSTAAAVEYLNDLHDKFWDWALVAAAYNRWENWLARDLKNQWVESYYDLYLNQETSRYVFRIVAIKYVMQSYMDRKDTIDTFIGGVQEIPNTKIIEVQEVPDLALWSQMNNISYKDVKILNRWIIGDSLSSWNWNITVLK